MQYDVALHLKAVLNEECSVAGDNELLIRQLDAEHLIRCGKSSAIDMFPQDSPKLCSDHCSQAFLFSSILCRLCGKELCIPCGKIRSLRKGNVKSIRIYVLPS